MVTTTFIKRQLLFQALKRNWVVVEAADVHAWLYVCIYSYICTIGGCAAVLILIAVIIDYELIK
jgi:hypothetical protein